MDNYGQTRFDHAELPTAEDNTIYFRRAPVKVPLNLTEWFPESQLLTWIRESLEQLESPKHAAGGPQVPEPDSRRTLLLTLMTLAYATQHFRSREIVNACSSEPVFANLCGGNAPFTDELEHFRRTNRAVLQTLLGLVLYKALEKKFDFEPGTVPAGLKRDLLIRAEERMDIARHMNTWDD